MRIEPVDKEVARVEITNSIKDTHKDLRQRSKKDTVNDLLNQVSFQ